MSDEFTDVGVADILRRAPFGISISADSGEVIVASPSGAGDGCREFGVAVGDRTFKIRLAEDAGGRGDIEDDLFRKAYFDDLTGLPNRRMFEHSVQALFADERDAFALAFIDLDGFKRINDYYGHAAGDQLLVKVAERLSGQLNEHELLARLGGDEFVLVIRPFTNTEDLRGRIEGISAALRRPFFVEGYEVLSSASIGVSLFPYDGRDYDVLRRNADSAMYRCKASAKGEVRLFDAAVQQAANQRAHMEQRVRLAIRDRRIHCAYQPKVDFRSDSIVGVEALLRWLDDEGLIQPPGDFIGLATELGLMNDVTKLILSQVVDSLDMIDQVFGPECTISFNVAARQIEDERFMDSILEIVDLTGAPGRFMLEITEEAFFAKASFRQRVMPMIREIGAKVAIDDFGVGYSSLSTLADVTADEIKVDKSFVTDIHRRPRSQSILRAIESLGQSLGMRVLVEGVETFEELAYLQAATRISLAQGYYFSKPVLIDEIDGRPHRRDASRTRSVGESRPHEHLRASRARSA